MTLELESIQLMFQGGFVGIECDVILIEEQDSKIIQTIFPEDINDLQSFKLNSGVKVLTTSKIELKFKNSSDFYGRVTVYMINLEGTIL